MCNLVVSSISINLYQNYIFISTLKAPLGKLSSKQIARGFSILANIEKAIKNGSLQKLTRLSSEYYTHIPHDYGFRKVLNDQLN